MKNLYVILLFIFAAISGTAQAAERKFSISSFEDVRIIGSVNVFISTGKGPSAKAEAQNREILDRISLRKNGSQLVVSVKSRTNVGRFSEDGPITVYLSSYDVKKITHAGSGAISLDKLGGSEPLARLGGFGVLSINDVDGDRLTVMMQGGGHLTIAGQVKKAQIKLLGSSNFDGSQLTVGTLDLIQRGPASSHIFVEKEANISNSGTGRIQIDGRPNCSVKSGGSAEIICNPKR
tara:strand:+ start:5243 stop:5947 length:705 start_codon:yes stop_codon:yes gene_type:complete